MDAQLQRRREKWWPLCCSNMTTAGWLQGSGNAWVSRGILREAGPPSTVAGSSGREHAVTLLFAFIKTRVRSGTEIVHLDQTNCKQCMNIVQPLTGSLSFLTPHLAQVPYEMGTQHFIFACSHSYFSTSHLPNLLPGCLAADLVCDLFAPLSALPACFLATTLAYHGTISDDSLQLLSHWSSPVHSLSSSAFL